MDTACLRRDEGNPWCHTPLKEGIHVGPRLTEAGILPFRARTCGNTWRGGKQSLSGESGRAPGVWICVWSGTLLGNQVIITAVLGRRFLCRAWDWWRSLALGDRTSDPHPTLGNRGTSLRTSGEVPGRSTTPSVTDCSHTHALAGNSTGLAQLPMQYYARLPQSQAQFAPTEEVGRGSGVVGVGAQKLEGKQSSPPWCPWRCLPPLRTRLRLCLRLWLGVLGGPAAGRAGGAGVTSRAVVVPETTGAVPQGLGSTILTVTVFLTG